MDCVPIGFAMLIGAGTGLLVTLLFLGLGWLIVRLAFKQGPFWRQA